MVNHSPWLVNLLPPQGRNLLVVQSAGLDLPRLVMSGFIIDRVYSRGENTFGSIRVCVCVCVCVSVRPFICGRSPV